MDTEATDNELVARLKRLDAGAEAPVSFGYDTLIDRHAARQQRARRRLAYARGTASALVVALVAASVWRFDQPLERQVEVIAPEVEDTAPSLQPRIVRADTYF